jgi:hypothetical protein
VKASVILTRAVRSLRVSPATMDRSRSVAEAAGVMDAEAAQKLYREWVNDLVAFVGHPQMAEAARNPDHAFLQWLGSRLTNPFHVTCRAHDAVRARYGGEAALLFAEVRWPQEVAWAHRMRGHDNDRIVFLAGMWLKAAKRDPAKLFRGLVRCYAEEASLDPHYARSDVHLCDAGEIRGGAVDDRHWRPLWLRFAEREFGPMANGMPRQKLTLLAQQVRETEFRERLADKRSGWAGRLRAARPALMLAVLQAAIDHGLSSDDLAAAEKAFIADVESGAVDIDGQPHPAWRLFLRTLPDWQGRSPVPDPGEAEERVAAVQGMSPAWTDALPADFLRLGAADQRRLLAWFDAVASDRTRAAPSDPAVDYGMWLVAALRRDPG